MSFPDLISLTCALIIVLIPIVAGMWLLADLAARRRQRQFDAHVDEALRQVSPNHPSVWRDDRG